MGSFTLLGKKNVNLGSGPVISQWKWKSSVNILLKMKKEEVNDVVATNENEDKKLEAEEDLDQHCDISVEMEKSSEEQIVEN